MIQHVLITNTRGETLHNHSLHPPITVGQLFRALQQSHKVREHTVDGLLGTAEIVVTAPEVAAEAA